MLRYSIIVGEMTKEKNMRYMILSGMLGFLLGVIITILIVSQSHQL